MKLDAAREDFDATAVNSARLPSRRRREEVMDGALFLAREGRIWMMMSCNDFLFTFSQRSYMRADF